MHEKNFRDQTFIFEPGNRDNFYSCHFVGCKITLTGGSPKFFMCSFDGCKFDPPIPLSGGGFGLWESVLISSIVDIR